MKHVGKSARKKARVTISSGSVAAFIERSLERARKLDHGEAIPTESAVTFEDPADLVRDPRPHENH